MLPVGFSGSRSLSASAAPAVSAAVGAVVAAGGRPFVGCARGADAFVRRAAPGAVVFSVASGAWGGGRSAFVGRSVALVRSVAGAACPAGWPLPRFFVFVGGPCPAGVVPAAGWSSGVVPSGSWSSAALAAGLGLPLVVVWCASGPPALPAWPGAWSPWSVVALGLPAFSWSAGQLSLFS